MAHVGAAWAMVALVAAGENLLTNVNFTETSTATKTGAAGWDANTNLYHRVTSPTLDGAGAALMFQSSDPNVYSTCSQPIRGFIPGYNYRLSGWVRTENITGADNGATLCVEWSGNGSTYIGGAYPSGIKGTQPWTYIVSEFVIPTNAVTAHTSVYVRKGMVGTAWWDDVLLEPVPPKAMETFLLAPAYRGRITSSWPPQLKVQVSMPDLAQLNPADYTFSATLASTPAGAAIEVVTLSGAALPPNRTAEAVFKVDPRTGLQPGEYTVTVRCLRGGSVELSTVYNLTRVADTQPPATVWVDGQRRMIVEGKPFFPIGMYAGDLHPEDFDRFRGSAFNSLMPYKQLNATQMDWAHAAGMKIAYTVKDDFCGHSLKCNTTDFDLEKVTQAVNAFKEHPATLMWYTNDELGVTWADTLAGHQRLIQSLDYNHPTWAVLYEAPETNLYVDTCDTIGTDPYPIPDHPASEVREWANDTHRLLAGTKAIFEVIQAHNPANYGHSGRTPTLNETRSMVWQAIAVGANGIFFYSYFDIQRNPDVPFETQWSHLSQVSTQVTAFAPCLLSDLGAAPATEFRAAGGEPAWLVTRERWCTESELSGVGDGAVLLPNGEKAVVVFAVSDGSGGGEVAFGLPARLGTVGSVTVVSETPARSIVPTGGGAGWTDSIDPLAIAVYVVRLKAQ